MPFVERNAELEEKQFQKMMEESEEARQEVAEFRANYELRKSLVEARKGQKISQKQLSQLTGLTQQAISKIETGKNSTTIGTLIKYLYGIGYGLQIQKIK